MNACERVAARLRGETVDRLPTQPLFMIYAADEIGVTYAEYVQDHRLLVRGQMALAEKFPLDVVSCCSDAWREAADCGAELTFRDRQPPSAEHPVLSSATDLAQLSMPDPDGGGRMTDRLEAIRLFAQSVKGEIPILGWIEGPIAAAVNLLGMTRFMLATKKQPDFVKELLDWTTEMEIGFAAAQVRCGADMIGMGDAAASLIAPRFYREYVAPRERRIVDAIHAAGATVRLHICGNIQGKYADMAATGADLIDVDAPQSIGEVRNAVGPAVCLSGNMDPVQCILKGDPEQIKRDTAECHRLAGTRYILAAGCEIPPGTPEANVAALFEYACSTT